MPTTHHVHSEPVALAFEGEASAPEWVQLTPAGPRLAARDGRRFVIDTAAVIAAFRDRRIELPLDYEHASTTRALKGLPSPAAGWIVDLEDRAGALWARIRWTDKGAAHVLAREYRFVSPSLVLDRAESERVLRLHSAGLTNTPAFEMAELAAATEETTRMPDAIREKLGLEEGASEADVLGAIDALKETTSNASEQEVDAALYVPRSDFEAATARLSELEEAEKVRGEAAIVGAVDAAITAGKIVPASRDIHLASCRAMGPEAFAAAMEKQPVIAGTTLAGRKPTEAEGAAGLTPDEIAVARELGQTPEQFAEGKKKDAV